MLEVLYNIPVEFRDFDYFGMRVYRINNIYYLSKVMFERYLSFYMYFFVDPI